MIAPATAMLDGLTHLGGVRGALVVSTSDGLVVAEAMMDGVDARPVAALVGLLVARVQRLTERAGGGAPAFVHLRAERGVILAAPAGPELVVVAVAEPTVNVGLVRLELRRAAEVLRA